MYSSEIPFGNLKRDIRHVIWLILSRIQTNNFDLYSLDNEIRPAHRIYNKARINVLHEGSNKYNKDLRISYFNWMNQYANMIA